MSSTDCVKSEICSGLSAKAIMKNSSCGFAVLKNSTTASRDFSILLLMLPLTSKITPMETGASSLEKFLISCGSLPSRMEKFSRSSPVTRRFSGSVMVTGTRTSSTPTLMGFSRVLTAAEVTRSFGTEPKLEPAGDTATGIAGGTPVSDGLGWAGGRTCGSSRGFWDQAAVTRQAARLNPSAKALSRVPFRGDNISPPHGLGLNPLAETGNGSVRGRYSGLHGAARKPCLLRRILPQLAMHEVGRLAQKTEAAETPSLEAFGLCSRRR